MFCLVQTYSSLFCSVCFALCKPAATAREISLFCRGNSSPATLFPSANFLQEILTPIISQYAKCFADSFCNPVNLHRDVKIFEMQTGALSCPWIGQIDLIMPDPAASHPDPAFSHPDPSIYHPEQSFYIIQIQQLIRQFISHLDAAISRPYPSFYFSSGSVIFSHPASWFFVSSLSGIFHTDPDCFLCKFWISTRNSTMKKKDWCTKQDCGSVYFYLDLSGSEFPFWWIRIWDPNPRWS